MITNVAGTCDAAQSAYGLDAAGHDAGKGPPNATRLTMLVFYHGAQIPPTGGDFPIESATGPYTAVATFEATDATCANVTKVTATSGTISLLGISTVAPGPIDGTFDLTFASGDHLTGQFYAPLCIVDLMALQGGGLGTCQP